MPKKTRRSFSAGQIQLCRELYETGFSQSNLSRTLNIPYKAVQRWRKRGNWTQGDIGGEKFANGLRTIIGLLTRELLLNSAVTAFGGMAQNEVDERISQQVSRLGLALKNLKEIGRAEELQAQWTFLKQLKSSQEAFFRLRWNDLNAEQQNAVKDFLSFCATDQG